MRSIFVLFLISFCSFIAFNQAEYNVLKENLTKRDIQFYDFNKSKIMSEGAYYVDYFGETMLKHGKWTYFDETGYVEEIRNYYKDKLHGKVVLFYPNKKPKQEGYFYLNRPDSIYKEWNELGNLVVDGNYKYGQEIGEWKYYYQDGRIQSIEQFKDSINYLTSFWMPDSNHTQTIKDGSGEMMTFFPNATLKTWYHYKDGLKHGKFEEHSIYGFKTLSGSFANGQKDGEWVFAYYSGKTDKISHYKNGKLDGSYQNFFHNGKISVEGSYQEGGKTGMWTWYLSNGNRDMQGTFKNDLQDGEWTYWYPEGQVSYTAHYTENKKSGLWTYYYKNGKIYREGTFSNDQENGVWKTWYEDGTLLMEGSYENGLEKGEWHNYWENGKLKNKSTFKNGKLNGAWMSYFPKGDLMLEGTYKEGRKTGEWTQYFENGKIRELKTYKIVKKQSAVNKSEIIFSSEMNGKYVAYSDMDQRIMEEGNYKDGQKVGTWKTYHRGGKLVAVESNYKDGKLEGTMKTFDKRGNIISSIEYKNGLKHGTFKLFDKRGETIKEMRYSEGMQVIEGQNNTPESFAPR